MVDILSLLFMLPISGSGMENNMKLQRLYSLVRQAMDDYHMIQDGDKIAVCISGGKDSILLAKLFQELKKHGQIQFDLVFLVEYSLSK